MRRLLILLAVLAAVFLALPAAAQEELPRGGTFLDDDGSVHEGAIEALSATGITQGCDRRGLYFCPDERVTRGQMAAFLVRALDIPSSDEDAFVDDDESIFQNDIDAIAAAGITKGCNPPDNDEFCPDDLVWREEMATFLVNALELERADSQGFTDVADSVHVNDINALAAAGITKGCNPPDNDLYCPDLRVTRAEMATFIARAVDDLVPVTPRERIIERVSRFTTYHDCCEARVHNIQLMADTLDEYIVKPGEVFSINEIVGPRTEAKGYVGAGYLLNGESACCVTGGGTSQFGTTMYNAIFWGGYEDVYHKPHSRYIDRYPLGIEATMGYPTLDVKFRNDTDSIVIVRTSHTGSSVTVELWGYADGWQISGYHPRGAQRSVMTILNERGRRVSGYVTGSASFSGGGSARVRRLIKDKDGNETNEYWSWRYLSEGGSDGFRTDEFTDLIEE